MANVHHVKSDETMIPNIVDLAKSRAVFVRYQDQTLWYRVDEFEFPIPVDDAGGGAFGPTEKGLTLMRWIRKHIEFLKKSIEKQTPQ